MEAQTHFTYGGKPIPPFFLTDFCGGPDGGEIWVNGMGSRVTAVAVEGLYSGNGCYGDITHKTDDYVSFHTPGRDGSGNTGQFGYHFVGTTPSGITVLDFFANTGGSGTICGVVLVRFETQSMGTTRGSRQPQLVMRFVGARSWGDRVDREVELEENQLRVSPAKSSLPAATTGKLASAETMILE